MPIEYSLLKDMHEPMETCPKCGARPFRSFLRGLVHNMWRAFFRRPYCCIICSTCKEIVGYEYGK
jgi:formate dehydrogenase maturation protein FdhE